MYLDELLVTTNRINPKNVMSNVKWRHVLGPIHNVFIVVIATKLDIERFLSICNHCQSGHHGVITYSKKTFSFGAHVRTKVELLKYLGRMTKIGMCQISVT